MSLADGGFGVLGSVVTPSYFTVLQIKPVLGRFFTDEEDRVPERNPVAVLSHDLWRGRYGSDSGIVGTTIRINGAAFTIVGIAPEGFRGLYGAQNVVDIWIPTAMFKVGYRYCDGFSRSCRVIGIVGRLADGATLQDAQTEMTVLARQLETTFPETNKGRGVIVYPARGIRLNEQTQNQPIVALIAAAAGLVLLVSSANVAGLLLARGLRRRKDIAIQLALGAGRWRLVQQLLVESTLLAVAGGAAGIFVAIWSADIVRGFFFVPLSIDMRVVGSGVAIALVIGVLTGLVPAFQATRRDTLPTLKDETAGAGTRRSLLREGLIVVQVAVSVLLLAASGLVARSFLHVHQGPGFDPDRLVVPRLRPSLVGYSDEQSWAFQREVVRRLEAIPGVIAASPANVPPLPRWGMANEPFQIAGETIDPGQTFTTATTPVGPRYFKALGVPMIDGREFDDGDRPEGPRVAIVNETLARRFWPTGGAVGSLVHIGGKPTEIVGVVKDHQFLSLFSQPDAVAYLNYWQQATGDNWTKDSRTHIGVTGTAAAMLPLIQRAIAAVDPDVPVTDVQPLSARIDNEFSELRTARALFVTFGSLTLVLSAIGLYAALAFAVGQRTREIAIRIALGAAGIDVGRLVLQRGAIVVTLGVVVGLVASTSAGPLLAHMLYGVNPRDPLTLVVGPSILVPVALLAIWLPARRAMRMNPIAALRSE